MDDLSLKSNQIKSLMIIAEENGVQIPFTFDDVNEIIDSNDAVITKLRALGRLHNLIHELVYAPPRR